jgi:acyl carrier protein
MATDAAYQTVLDVITDALVTLGTDRDEVTVDAQLSTLDIDSLDIAELAQMIDERFSVQIAAADLVVIETVGDLARLVASRA